MTPDSASIKLSVVIITFNEEKNIGRCLDSITSVADDIVVVDSFSTDATEKICRERGARFVQHKFEGHIEQKNWAITQAKYPHILSLDADEALSEPLQKQISTVKPNWACDGYYLKRLTNYCGEWIKHSGWYPDKKLRLWDSRKGKWGGENPHDKFELNPGAVTAVLEGDLLHYSYHSIEQHIDQINLFSRIKAETAYRKGKRSGVLPILFAPLFKFFKGYFLKMGILDGFYGFVICVNSAHSEFLRYVKLREKWKKRSD